MTNDEVLSAAKAWLTANDPGWAVAREAKAKRGTTAQDVIARPRASMEKRHD